ncbi:MAG: hypothetical protein M3P94_06370 [Chloroflexota bacterium]|nr:hypothetical protein [Chloroflexota bacterium]
MIRTCLIAVALFAAIAAGLTWSASTGQGAAQSTGTAGPIVIEFSTATPTEDAAPTSDDEATNTPVVFEIATAATTVDTDVTATAAAAGEDDDADDDEAVSFDAADWTGGFYQSDPDLQAFYGRPWLAVYGSESEYPSATLAFTLDDEPDEAITLTVLGLDDELDGLNPITIEINGRLVYEGDDVFPNWNTETGNPEVWSQVGFRIAPGLLQEGDNSITIANLTPADTFGGPPYLLLGAGRFSGGDVEITVGDDDDADEDDAGESAAPGNGNGNPGNDGDNGNDDNNGNDDSPRNGNGNGNGNDDQDEDDDEDDG